MLLVAVAAWWGVDSWRFHADLDRAREDLDHGRASAARERLARLAARRPGRADVAMPLGLSERRLGRIDAALAAWGDVAPGAPGGGPIALHRAKLALEHGRLAVAEAALNKALAEGGINRDEVLSHLARVLRLQGRMAELRPKLVEGLGRSAVPAELLRELWRLETEPLPIEGLRGFLERASGQAPDDDRVWLGLAYLAIRTGVDEAAGTWLERCERRRAADPAVLRAKLERAVAAGDAVMARRALSHPALGPFRPAEAAALRAWFAARSGDPGAERAALEEWLRVDPGSSEALERLAVLAEDAGRVYALRRRKAELDGAREAYNKLLSRGDLGSARELSRLAGVLRRRLEERGWAVLANEPAHDTPRVRDSLGRIVAAEPEPLPADRLLASLPAEIRTHPDRHPAIPIRAGPRPAFVDDADRVGLVFSFDNGQSPQRQFPETGGGGVGVLDYDGDGWLDVYCLQGGPFPPPGGRASGDRLFRNRGDGTFEDATERAGLAAAVGGYGHGVAVGDVDGDGRPDLFLTRFGAYALLRNRGDGTFEDATERAGLGGPRGWPTSAAFADLDGDGDLDLYVCHYLKWDTQHPTLCPHPKTGEPSYCQPTILPHLQDHLFRNDGGHFVDVTEAAGIVDPDGRGLGVVAADLDGDGRTDLYVANDMTANFLFRNIGGLRFEETGHTCGVAADAGGGYQAGMGVACGDLDGDGRTDLAVTNFYGESTTLYRNLRPGLFADHTAAAGLAAPTRFVLGFGIVFLDANNDGHVDLMQTNGHVNDFRPDTPYAMATQLLIGDGNGRLADVTAHAGPPFTVPRVGRALAIGDLDNDGRLDALVIAYDRPLAYFHNQTPRDGHFLVLRLEGTTSNRDGVGARVTLTAGGRRQVAQRLGGGSYQSASDGRLHFGLGEARRVEWVEVAWPSGHLDRFVGLESDTGYHLREGDPVPRPLAGFRWD